MKNIYQRVNDVLGEGKALEKGGKMSGAGGNYSFHRTDDVLAMLRPLLVAHGIHFGYTVSEHVVTTVEKPVSYTHLRSPRDQRGSRMPSSA